MKLKQYGLPYSGTNVTKAFFQWNFEDCEVDTARYGSKHGPCALRREDGIERIVATVKDPYGWLFGASGRSGALWASKPGGETVNMGQRAFADFLREPFDLDIDVTERGIRTLRFGTPIDCWNTMNRHWLDVADIVVRCETFLSEEQAEELAVSLAAQGLERKGELILPRRKMEPTGGPVDQREDHQPRTLGLMFDRAYYLEKRYLEAYGFRELGLVDEGLDWPLARELGYERVSQYRNWPKPATVGAS